MLHLRNDGRPSELKRVIFDLGAIYYDVVTARLAEWRADCSHLAEYLRDDDRVIVDLGTGPGVSAYEMAAWTMFLWGVVSRFEGAFGEGDLASLLQEAGLSIDHQTPALEGFGWLVVAHAAV